MRSEEPRTEAVNPTDTPPEKKAYAAPEISWTEQTEIRANLSSACVKAASDGGACSYTPGS